MHLLTLLKNSGVATFFSRPGIEEILQLLLDIIIISILMKHTVINRPQYWFFIPKTVIGIEETTEIGMSSLCIRSLTLETEICQQKSKMAISLFFERAGEKNAIS